MKDKNIRRIAWFATLSATNGELLLSRYYSEVLLPLLSESYEIEVFVDDEDWINLRFAETNERRFCGCRVHHGLSAYRRDLEDPFDLFVYQLEDTGRVSFVRKMLELMPGLVIFHDANLSQMRLKHIEHATTGEGLSRLAEEIAGEEQDSSIGDWVARGWSLDRALSSIGSIAHDGRFGAVCGVKSDYARAALSETGLPLAQIGFPVQRLRRSQTDKDRLRKSFPGDFIIGFSGTSPLDFRFDQIVSLFNNLPRTTPVRLAHINSPTENAERAWIRIQKLAEERNVDLSRVLKVTVSNWDEFRSVISECDLFLGLRFDSLRDIPPGVFFAMAEGVPVVVNDFGPSSELPSHSVFKIPTGREERRTLYRLVKELMFNGELRSLLSERGRMFAEDSCDPYGVAHDLHEIFVSYRQSFAEELERRRRIYGLSERRSLEGVQREVADRVHELGLLGQAPNLNLFSRAVLRQQNDTLVERRGDD